MASKKHARPHGLGMAEQSVMDFLWANGPASADQCREALRRSWPMKESTMRTVLTRLEEKGFLTHVTEGRTYIYRATEAPTAVATRAVKHIVDRLCGGSAEALVLGMVNNAMLSPQQLERLARRIAEEKGSKS